MIAKKCDRCGKYYDTNNRFSKNGYYINGTVFLTGSRAVLHSTAMDLCDDCVSELKKFLKGAIAENEEN